MSQTLLIRWVKDAAAGDANSWNALHKKFYPGMYAIALRICGDNEIAADVIQDAFVTCYLKLSQLKEPNRFAGWLQQIVIHTCYRALSSHRNTNISLEQLSTESGHFGDDEITRSFEDFAIQSKLYGALAALPEVLNSTLLLRYFSKHQSYEEIAAILCIPVGTVRSRLNQARIKLGEYWLQHDDVDNASFRESEEWNDFYHSIYGGMHAYDQCKATFVEHLGDSSITFPDGKSYDGGDVIERMLREDREVGSWLKPVNIFSSGTVSVIEAVHFNSKERPGHCPAGSIVVLYRNCEKVSKLYLHAASK